MTELNKQQELWQTTTPGMEYDRVLPAGVLRVLVACEYSGTVREAFKALGHDAMSCDLLDTEIPGKHYKGDVLDILCDGWDIMIAHPPCTHLAVSGARWFKDKKVEQAEALEFVRLLLNAPIEKIALENPISIISSHIRKPDQIIQPWQFGHGETKATCLWLQNLPKLQPTNIVEGREQRIWKMPPGENRWKERSRTFGGIAQAMANQWGNVPTETKRSICV
jgi:site-specific DNA-cytosine methylase